MKNNRFALLMAICALFSSCATVRLTQDERDALNVLQRYVQLDRSGARLDGTRYHSMAELVSWTDEPGWDSFVVSPGLAIGRPVAAGEKVTARVRYDVEGVMDGDTFYPLDALTPEASARFGIGDPVEYVLVRMNDEWKIESPLLPPHVGFGATRAFVEELGAESSLRALDDAEYLAKLKGARAGHCNCDRLDF
ncbi:MAG: hypothetical protein HUU46_17080 [Candidatus Hydrogenedentes bacterium]|nr:hypothetical protein [Candidatus Hydrogenedentota bacterium]